MTISSLNMQIQSIISSAKYLLIMVLGIVLAQLAWKIITFSDYQEKTPASDISTQNKTLDEKNTTIHLNTIMASDLFGASIKEQPLKKAVTIAVKNLKNTKLSLQLTGLIKGLNSVAVIVYQNRQRAYAPGDFIVNTSNLKVRLDSVENNYVIIINNDVPERLNLPKRRTSSAASLGIAENGNSPESPKTINLDLNSQQMKSLLGENPKKIITTNPLSLSKYMQISPKLEGGKLTGYKISAGPDQRLLKLTGVQTGDIITHVEGLSAADLTIANMYKTLQLKHSINVTVERNGSVITMDIKL